MSDQIDCSDPEYAAVPSVHTNDAGVTDIGDPVSIFWGALGYCVWVRKEVSVSFHICKSSVVKNELSAEVVLKLKWNIFQRTCLYF